MRTETLFVGVGSPHGDDRAGWLVADALSDLFGTDVSTQASGTLNAGGLPSRKYPSLAIRKTCIPADLLDWLDGAAKLIICDALCGAGPANSE